MDPTSRSSSRPPVDVPDPVWPSTEWPAGPVGPPTTPHPSPSTPREREAARRSDRWALVLALMGGVLLGVGVTFGVLGALGLLGDDVISVPRTTQVAAPTTTVVPSMPVEGIPSVTEVASAAIPSIVAVSVVSDSGFNGGGSGVVYGDEGHLITNHHVVDGAEQVGVIFADGVSYPAEVVGSDPLTDIAVISTNRPDLAPISVGTEADLVIGERTVAVGNPLGLQGGPSVTSGILSATDRTLVVEADTTLYGLLQTDAPITRGSSGGALLDQEAKLIGITTAIGITDVGAEGLGFAVPVDVAVGVADDIIADGQVQHAMLGIQGTTVTEERQGATVPVGVGVTEITDGSAYRAAGGEIEDVIVSLEGEPVSSIQQLIARLRTRRAGNEVMVQVLRGDEELTFAVELGEWTQ